MKLPRTIRLDPSDTVVFATPAAPGEWAVSGAFLFAGRDPATLDRKARIAFRTGWLGLASFGFATLVTVAEGDPAEAEAALAAGLVAHLGAPDAATAGPAAREEVAFAASLCAPHPVGATLALHREAGPDGAIRERFRALRPRAETSLGAATLRGHARAFDFVETDAPPEPATDLAALLRSRR